MTALREATGATVHGPANERIPEPFEPLRDGDRVQALGLVWQVIDVPGHTAGHIAFFCDGIDGEPFYQHRAKDVPRGVRVEVVAFLGSTSLEMRALAIALFYAVGTGLGGIAAPIVFGALIETGSRENVFLGYAFGAGLMIAAAIVQGIWGVAAERRALEDVARPLTAVD